MNTIANTGKRCLALSLALLILFSPGIPYGANNLWTQTDWYGGADTSIDPVTGTGIARHPGDQTGWTKFYSKSPSVDSSTPGQLSLTSTTGSWIQTTDADFTVGTLTNLQVIGTGAAAALTLGTYLLDRGNGTDGDLLVDGATVALDGTKSYNSVTVRNGGVLTTSPAASLTSPANVRIAATSVPAGTGLIGTFYYTVTALDRFGFETPRSPLSDNPNQNKIANSLTNQTPLITWDPVAGASGYKVYRKVATAGYATDPYASPSLICSISDQAITSCQDSLTTPLPGAPHLKTPPAPSAAASATGGALSDGTYYYVVTAIDFSGLETAKGTQQAIAVAGGAGSSSVLLSWGGNGEAMGYRVYRSTQSGIFNDPSLICETGSTTCTDTLASPLPGAPPRSYDQAVVNGGLHLKVVGTLSVDAASSIDLSGKGYPAGVNTATSTQGLPGKGPGTAGNRGGGGGYGTAGTTNSNPAFPAEFGVPYGDPLVMAAIPGSGGASGSFTSAINRGGNGGNGGGAVRISADSVLLNGTLRADGSAGKNVNAGNTDPGGGGSGGYIFLEGNSVVNNGTISAVAGNGGLFTGSGLNTPSYYATGGNGGNGRIRITSASAPTLGALNPPAVVGDLGLYESPSLDVGTGGARFSNHTLSWLLGAGSGGNLKFLIAANKDNATWVFRGPDGTPEGSAAPTYYTTPGLSIWAGHDGDRYLRYKILFEAPTTNPADRPILDSVTIGFEYNPSFQSLVSSPYDSGDPSNTLRRLQWDETRPAGTGIHLQMRTGADAAALQTAGWTGTVGTTLVNGGIPVQNAGFESCASNYTAIPGWTNVNRTTTSGCYNVGPRTGTWAAYGGRNTYFYQTFALMSGISYTFTVWAKSSHVSQSATLLISSAAGGGTTYCNPSTTSTAYTPLTCSLTPSANMTVYLNLVPGSTAGYSVWFDDAAIAIDDIQGLQTIDVAGVNGFAAGDRITLTDPVNPSWEEVNEITAVDAANNRMTLASPLRFNYGNGTVVSATYTDAVGTQPIYAGHRDGVNDQWYQYRVFLTTDNGVLEPVFLANRIGYLPAAGEYKPDGALDTDGNGTYDNGDGVYGAFGSGSGGEAGRNVNPAFRGGGQPAAYPLQIQNDGNAVAGRDTYTLTWSAPPDDPSGPWSAVLYDGSGNPLASPATVTLDAGGFQNFILQVTPSLYAPAGSTQTVVLNVRSENEYAQADSIRTVTTVNPIFQGDGLLDGSGNGDGSGTGPGYDTAGTGQGGAASRSTLPGENASYTLRLENEGNIQDSYALSQTSTCVDSRGQTTGLPTKWRVFIDDGTLDHDISSSSVSWTTDPPVPATVNAGSISGRDYTLKIYTAGEPAVCETVVKIASTKNTLTDPADDVLMDSVKATTSLSPTYGVDLWIEGSHGDNLYGGLGTGGGGSYDKGIAGGTTGTFGFSVQHEGNVTDFFELSWTAPAGWTTAILGQDGATLCTGSPCVVPPSTQSCPFQSGSQCLAIPGEVIPLKLQATAPASFTSGSADVFIDGKSMGDPAKVDSIRARAWANALTLTVASVTSKSATLAWTAPSWSAKIYDLRYSTKQIIEDGLTPGTGQINFSNATAARGLATPKSAGSAESFTVTQLYADTPYYFALKTKVGAAYTSVISLCANCPGRTAVSTDDVLPSQVTGLSVTAATADSVTLCWTAPSDDGGSEPVTGYLLNYSPKMIVETAPGMGEILFSDASPAEGVGVPRTPGAQECYRIPVENILAGNDGLLNTADDLNRTPNTQFFFALKAEDENHNPSPLSNRVQGNTAMSSSVYNMISLPKAPSPDTPVDVFVDDVGTPLYLYWWDSRGVGHDRGCYDGYDDPGNSKDGPYNPNNEVPGCVGISAVSAGNGYFLWSPRLDIVLDAPAGSSDVGTASCTDENGQTFTCYIFPLQEGWNMIGNPFGKEVDLNAIKVRQTRQQGQQTTVTTATFLQAVTAMNWMENAVYTHNGTSYTYEFCDNTGCGPALQPWKGYWIWLHKQGDGGGNTTYDLLIPKP